MSNVSFDSENSTNPQSFGRTQGGGITRFLITHKVVKDAKQANVMLLVIAAAALVFSGVFFIQASGKSPAPSREEVRMEAWLRQGHVGAPPPSFMP